MNEQKKIFLMILIIISGLIGAVIIIKDFKTKQNPENQDLQIAKEMISDYESEMKIMAEKYYKINDFSKNKSEISDLKTKMFEIKVPSIYKSMHLDILIGLDIIEKGITAKNQDLITKGSEKINSALNNANFLKK